MLQVRRVPEPIALPSVIVPSVIVCLASVSASLGVLQSMPVRSRGLQGISARACALGSGDFCKVDGRCQDHGQVYTVGFAVV